MKSSITLLLSLGLLCAGCNDDDDVAPNVTGTATVQALNDAQSAAVLSSLNTGEINAAQVAAPKTASTTVRDFANMMITEHGQAQAAANTLLEQQGIVAQANAVSQAVDATGRQVVAQLTATQPSTIDSAYMNSQVAMHHDALTLIDCAILPGVQNAALKDFVTNMVRPAVEKHFIDASEIVATLPANLGPVNSTGSSMTAMGGQISSPVISCTDACNAQTAGSLAADIRNAACR